MSRERREEEAFRILLVSEGSREPSDLVRRLRTSGYRLAEAAPGEALRAAAETRPHLVMLDWSSPEGSFLELCSSLRREPRLAQSHVFAVFRRQPSLEEDEAVYRAGLEGYMVEPLDDRVLADWLYALASLEPTSRWLADMREGYRIYVDTVGVMILVLTPDGRVALVNRRGLEILGLPEEEVVGRNWFSHFLPAEERFRLQRYFFSLFSAEAGTHHYAENRVLRPDGEERVLAWRNTTIVDSRGRAVAVMSSGDDITERKAVERSLREALARREELKLIVNRSPAVAFLWKNEKGFPVEFVSQNVRQFGYQPEELMSRRAPYTELIHPHDLERVTAEVVEYSREGREEFRQEYRILTASGDVRWVEDSTWVRRDENGRVTHYQGIVMDVTERLQYQKELEELNKELEAFATSLSHDLKNPLSNALGYAMTLKARFSQPLEEMGKEVLAGVITSLLKLEEMVDRMLEYAVAGRKAAVVGNVSLQSLAERVVRELRDNGTLEGVKVTVHDGLPTVRGDPMVISRVLENLVVNAAKYRRTGADPEVEIGGETVDGEKALFVRDNGLGIRQRDLERIFDPLARAEDALSRPGYGLGLAIAKRCVEGWGGRIWAESEYGKGSTFHFTLPS